MKQYFKVMLGRKSCMAEECHQQGYIGTGFLHRIDLSNSLYEPREGRAPLGE